MRGTAFITWTTRRSALRRSSLTRHFAAMERDEAKADEVLRQASGIDDQKGMQRYVDRAKVRDVVGTKYMRELKLR